MVVNALKKLFSRSVGWEEWNGGVEVGIEDYHEPQPDYNDLLTKLMLVDEELGRFKHELAEDLSNLFFKIRELYRQGKKDDAEVLLVDYALKRELYQSVVMLDKLFQATIRRLKTMRSYENMSNAVLSMYQMLSMVSTHLAQISSDHAVRVQALKDMMENIIRQSTAVASGLPKSESLIGMDPLTRKTFEEAFREAKEETDAVAPQPAKIIDYEELEAKVLDYIKRNNGVIKLRAAASELGVSPGVIKEVLYRLVQKGVITLSKSSGQRQAAPA